jgi:hypothetical protein
MAWERRGGKTYYYQSVRQGTTVRKLYLGAGEKAQLAADADRATREARRQAADLRAEQDRPVTELAELLDELETKVNLVVGCQLLAAGWRRHHREWRPCNDRRRKQKR